ncbi:MAG: class I adenylate-forming enzyme family protein [Pseudomonadota bacterium]|nr:class I adenylate-forming enzyme family protein [Pseudomonadota bacterium]
MRVIRYTDEMIEEFKADGYWTTETFYDFWEKNASELADREALVDSRYRITWGEALPLVNSIAAHFISRGISRDARIIIQVPNTAFGFLARIAAERAGLVALVAYPYLREKELDYMLERTQAEAVVCPFEYRNFNYLEMFKNLNQKHQCIKYYYLLEEELPAGMGDEVFSLIKAAQERKQLGDEEYRQRRFDPCRNVCLLTSTTGTTGIPKLVEWPIASRLCTSKSRVDLWDLTSEDVTFAIAPHAGGAGGTLTYFAAPLVGAKVVLLEDFDPELALATVEKESCTAIGVVPTHLVRMLEKDVEKYNLSSLRFIRSAGGYLSPQLAEDAENRLGGAITSDLGTQDVGSVSGCKVTDPVDLRRRTVGRALPGNVVKLLDDDDNEVPEGEAGGLWFRGPHAPAGYYRDLETTMTVFREDGWTTTGDLVKYDRGCLWIMGRKKDMIIRGGQNIYPAEIEGLLNEHPAVANVAVVAMPDPEFGEKACAFTILKKGGSLTFQEMVDFLKEKQIARYKLPERHEIIDAFPTVGDSGKVNKNTLKTIIADKLKSEAGN